jgi:hypothetical protein
MLDDMIKLNGLTLSNYALQSQATDKVRTLLYQIPQHTKGTHHAHTNPSATLRGKMSSWPQALIAVLVLLLEEVKVAGINKIKDELRY